MSDDDDRCWNAFYTLIVVAVIVVICFIAFAPALRNHDLKPPDFAVMNALIQNGTLNAADGATPLFTGTFDFTLTAKNPNKRGTTLIYAFNATQVKVGLEYDIFLIDGSGAYNRQRLRHGYVDLASTAAAMVPPFNQTGGNVTTLPLSLQANGVALDGNATITIEAQKNASTAIFATIEVNAVILIQKGDSEPKPRGLLVRCDAVFSYSSSPQQSSNDDEPDCRSHLCSGSNFNCTDEF
ncbi:unnamed protein product [Cuscuta epithymum]|uniref:Late embryogenesis abundant protein LEA-2 subgroup domain-containing protein n=1 Tax=Cuscuta epithymum TaxID=186058 RepID=A0AAV0CYN9_9ASTE|nr:unnamed protein product [Cuscuta epithymum]